MTELRARFDRYVNVLLDIIPLFFLLLTSNFTEATIQTTKANKTPSLKAAIPSEADSVGSQVVVASNSSSVKEEPVDSHSVMEDSSFSLVYSGLFFSLKKEDLGGEVNVICLSVLHFFSFCGKIPFFFYLSVLFFFESSWWLVVV